MSLDIAKVSLDLSQLGSTELENSKYSHLFKSSQWYLSFCYIFFLLTLENQYGKETLFFGGKCYIEIKYTYMKVYESKVYIWKRFYKMNTLCKYPDKEMKFGQFPRSLPQTSNY